MSRYTKGLIPSAVLGMGCDLEINWRGACGFAKNLFRPWKVRVFSLLLLKPLMVIAAFPNSVPDTEVL